MMKKNALGIVVLGSLGLVAACGSSSSSSSSPPVMTPATCVDPTGPDCKIPVADGSFVKWAGQVIDGPQGGASSAVVTHTPGKLCMAGTVDPGANGVGWGAILVVGLVDLSATETLTAPFDASAHGVTQVRFMLEDPPPQGILPQAVQIMSADCKQIPSCLTGFSLAAPVTAPGSVTLKLTDFTEPGDTSSNTRLDPTLLASLQFYIPTSSGVAVPYDFCLQDIAFLGADGREIKP